MKKTYLICYKQKRLRLDIFPNNFLQHLNVLNNITCNDAHQLNKTTARFTISYELITIEFQLENKKL